MKEVKYNMQTCLITAIVASRTVTHLLVTLSVQYYYTMTLPGGVSLGTVCSLTRPAILGVERLVRIYL